jgi:hypothetical protein
MKTIRRFLADDTAAIAIDDRLIATGNSRSSGIYVFLISFACVYYLVNAPLLLGHYDLGWHLAAGDLIRDRGNIPFQDPWSFTSGGRQWYNLSWLWDVIASVLFQYANFSGLILFVVAQQLQFLLPFFARVCFTPLLRRTQIFISPLRQTWLRCCSA